METNQMEKMLSDGVMQPVEPTEAEFEAGLLTARGMTKSADGIYGVPSSSGTEVYAVQFAGRGNCDGERLWTCTCPAGMHGKTCKHITAVGEINNAVCDEFGFE